MHESNERHIVKGYLALIAADLLRLRRAAGTYIPLARRAGFTNQEIATLTGLSVAEIEEYDNGGN